MYIDDYLILSDAQAITSSTNSTNMIDTLAAGSGINDSMWVQFLVDTAFEGTTGSSVQFIIQTSAAGSTFTNMASASVVIASLTAQTVAFCCKLPLGMLRYIRAYYTVTGTLTAGKIDCRLIKDPDVTMDKVL